MKRLLISAFAIAALSTAPALAQSSDHHNPRDKTTHTQGHGTDNSGSHGDHGGTSGGPSGGASSDHTTTTRGHQDHGGTSGGPSGGGSTVTSDHTTGFGSHGDHGGTTGGATGGHEDHGMTGGVQSDHQGNPSGGDHGAHPGVMQSITGQFTGGTHQPQRGVAPRTHRPSNWNQRPRQFDSHTYQRNMNASRRFHWRSYQRPHGWYDHRWVFGEIMPSFFWAQNYWISDWWMFDLMPPPYGYEWVRYGDDALLINTDTGEVLQVEYNLFD